MEGIGKGMFAVFSMLLLLGVNFASAQAVETIAYSESQAELAYAGLQGSAGSGQSVQASSGTGVIAQDNAGAQASSDADAQNTVAPRWYGGGLDFAIMEADDYSLEVGQGTYVYIYAYDASGKATPEEGTEVRISVRDSCNRLPEGVACVALARGSVGKVEYDSKNGRYVAKFSAYSTDRYMLYATITKGADEIVAGPRYISVQSQEQQVCPQLVSPSPDFCKDGEIVSGGLDKNGCNLPPKCIIAEQAIGKEAESKVGVKEKDAQPPKKADEKSVQPPKKAEKPIAAEAKMSLVKEYKGNAELLVTIERLIAELLTLRMQLLASS